MNILIYLLVVFDLYRHFVIHCH